MCAKLFIGDRGTFPSFTSVSDCTWHSNLSAESLWFGPFSKKYTPVQALRLCTGRTAHRGNRGIALLFHDHCTRRGWGVRVTPQLLFTPRKDPVPIVQEAGWAPGPVWTGAENLAPTGIRSADCPARSQSFSKRWYWNLWIWKWTTNG
jgi:hypothetical protein